MATSPVLPSGAAAQRRALIRHYKDNPPPMGVYAVRCDAAQLVCVQSSMNLPGAFNRDQFQLRMGGHPDRSLQQAWHAHGEAALRFEVLDTLKRRGVDIEFVLFPDEGHGWRKEANRVKSTMEMTRFFREHLLGAR